MHMAPPKKKPGGVDRNCVTRLRLPRVAGNSTNPPEQHGNKLRMSLF